MPIAPFSLRVAFVSGVVVGSAVGAHGCSFCTHDVCSSRLSIDVTERDGIALSPGSWSFEFVADGEQPLVAICEIGENSRFARCEGDHVEVWPMILGNPDQYTRFEIFFDGDDGSVVGLPGMLEVKIVHDGSVVYDEAFAPDYDLVKPERCDSNCYAATIEIVLQRA